MEPEAEECGQDELCEKCGAVLREFNWYGQCESCVTKEEADDPLRGEQEVKPT